MMHISSARGQVAIASSIVNNEKVKPRVRWLPADSNLRIGIRSAIAFLSIDGAGVVQYVSFAWTRRVVPAGSQRTQGFASSP
jgi:hypothetical protein